MIRACFRLFRRTSTSGQLHTRGQATRGMAKSLVAFDFDDTIVDLNTDMYIQQLAPGGIPASINALYSTKCWIDYMAAVFKYLHANNVTVDQLKTQLGTVPLVQGMKELFSHLQHDRYDVIIISDANVLFIEWILHTNGLHCSVDKIFSNPAVVDAEGCLQIEYFHRQDWCELSSINMCKGHILEEYIRQSADNGITYDRVCYVGDGANDYCPSARLTDRDVVFPRENFRLIKKITEQGNIKAQVVPWFNATEIMHTLASFHNDDSAL